MDCSTRPRRITGSTSEYSSPQSESRHTLSEHRSEFRQLRADLAGFKSERQIAEASLQHEIAKNHDTLRESHVRLSSDFQTLLQSYDYRLHREVALYHDDFGSKHQAALATLV